MSTQHEAGNADRRDQEKCEIFYPFLFSHVVDHAPETHIIKDMTGGIADAREVDETVEWEDGKDFLWCWTRDIKECF